MAGAVQRTPAAPRVRRGVMRARGVWLGVVVARGVRLGMVVAALLLVGPAPARAHAALEASQPADGQRLPQAPPAVILRFNEPVELALTSVQVRDPAGTPVRASAPGYDGTGREVVQVRLAALDPGSYLVSWRTVSADSHPIQGTFSFSLAGSPAASRPPAAPATVPPDQPADPATARPGQPAARSTARPGQPAAQSTARPGQPAARPAPANPAGAGHGAGDLSMASSGVRAVGPLFTVARLLASTALLTLIGGAAFLAFLRRPAASTRRARRLERRAYQLLWAALEVGLVTTLAGLLLQGPYAAGLPLGDALRPDLLARVLPTRFGEVWGGRMLLLLLAIPLLRAARHPDRPLPTEERLTGGLLGLGLVVSAGLSGHAAADSDPVLAMALVDLHFAAVAVWLGGLVLLVASVLPGGRAGLREVVPRFSQVAFGAMVVIVATGALQSLRAVDGPEALLTTGYGHLLLLKLVAFGVLLAVASISREWVRARLLPAPPEPGRPDATPARVQDGAPVLASVAPVGRGGPTAMRPVALDGPAGVLVVLPPLDAPAPVSEPPTADSQASVALLRRFVLAEVAVALVILAVTALLAGSPQP